MSDSNRLRAIHTLADLAQTGIPERAHDTAADLLVRSLYTLGVTQEEIQDAMSFAILTNGEDAA